METLTKLLRGPAADNAHIFSSSWALAAWAISAANLSLLPFWRILILTDPSDRYWMPLATPWDQAAAIVTLLGLALAIFLVSRLFLMLSTIPGHLLFIVLLLLGYVTPLFFVDKTAGHYATFILLVLCVGSAAVGLTIDLWSISTTRRFGFYMTITALMLPFLILAPFAPLNIAQSAYAAFTQGVPLSEPAIVNRDPLHQPTHQRVIWIVFDELDQRMLFRSRPGGYSYPAFDALANQAFRMDRVIPPGGHTAVAMAAYFLGEPVQSAEPIDESQLSIVVGGRDEILNEQQHIFQQAYSRGTSIALVGFYHPYCRLFAGYLNRCDGFHFQTARMRTASGFIESLGDSRYMFAQLLPQYAAKLLYHNILENSLSVATDDKYQFIFLHFSVPHYPFFFNAAEGHFETLSLDNRTPGYHDNVSLADKTLAELHLAMGKANLWDDSVVVVTADHGWREVPGYDTDPGAIPLVVKLAGQRSGIRITSTFDAVHLHDLLLALLDGDIASSDEFIAWLSRED